MDETSQNPPIRLVPQTSRLSHREVEPQEIEASVYNVDTEGLTLVVGGKTIYYRINAFRASRLASKIIEGLGNRHGR